MANEGPEKGYQGSESSSDNLVSGWEAAMNQVIENEISEYAVGAPRTVTNESFGQNKRRPLEPDGAPPNIIQSASVESAPLIKLDSTESKFSDEKESDEDSKMGQNQTSWLHVAASSSSKGSQGSYADQVPALSGSGSAHDPFNLTVKTVRTQEDVAKHARTGGTFNTPKAQDEELKSHSSIQRVPSDESASKILPSRSADSGNLDSILGPNGGKTTTSGGNTRSQLSQPDDSTRTHTTYGNSASQQLNMLDRNGDEAKLTETESMDEILGPKGAALASLEQVESLDDVLGPSLTEPSNTRHERSVLSFSTNFTDDTGSNMPKGRSRPTPLHIPETMMESPNGSAESETRPRNPIDRIAASLNNHQKAQTRPHKVAGGGLRRPGVEQSDSEISQGSTFDSGSSFQTSPSHTPVSGVSDQGSSWSESQRDQFSPGSFTDGGSVSSRSRRGQFSPNSFTDGGSRSVSSRSTNLLSPGSYTDNGSHSVASRGSYSEHGSNPLSPGSYTDDGSRFSANPMSPGSFSGAGSRSTANPMSPGSFSEDGSKSGYSTNGNPLSPGSITEDETFGSDCRRKGSFTSGAHSIDGTLSHGSASLFAPQRTLSGDASSFSHEASSFSQRPSMSNDEARATAILGVISENESTFDADDSTLPSKQYDHSVLTGYSAGGEEDETMSPGGDSAMTGFFTATGSKGSPGAVAPTVNSLDNGNSSQISNTMQILPEIESMQVKKSLESISNLDERGSLCSKSVGRVSVNRDQNVAALTVETVTSGSQFGAQTVLSAPPEGVALIPVEEKPSPVGTASKPLNVEELATPPTAPFATPRKIETITTESTPEKGPSSTLIVDVDIVPKATQIHHQVVRDDPSQPQAEVIGRPESRREDAENENKPTLVGPKPSTDTTPSNQLPSIGADLETEIKSSGDQKIGYIEIEEKFKEGKNSSSEANTVDNGSSSSQLEPALPPLPPKMNGLTPDMMAAMPPPPPPPPKKTPAALALSLPPPPPPPTPPPPRKRRSMSSKGSKESNSDSSKASRSSSKSGLADLKTPLVESASEGSAQESTGEPVETQKSQSQLTASLMARTRSRADTSTVVTAIPSGGDSIAFDKSNMVRVGERQDEKFIVNTALAKKRVSVVQLLAFGLVGILVGFLGSLYVQSTCHFVSAQVQVGDDGQEFDLHYGLWKYSPVESAFQGYKFCYEYDDGYSYDAPRFSRGSSLAALVAFTFSLVNLWVYLIFGKATRILWEAAVRGSLMAGFLQLSTMAVFLGPICRQAECTLGPGATVSLCASAVYFMMAFEMHYNSPIQSWMDDVPNCPSSEQPHRMVENLEMTDVANSAVAYVKRLVSRSPTGTSLPTLNQIQRNKEDPFGEGMFERELSQQHNTQEGYKPPNLV